MDEMKQSKVPGMDEMKKSKGPGMDEVKKSKVPEMKKSKVPGMESSNLSMNIPMSESMNIPMQVLIKAAKDREIAKDRGKNRFELLKAEPEEKHEDIGSLKVEELEGERVVRYVKSKVDNPKGQTHGKMQAGKPGKKGLIPVAPGLGVRLPQPEGPEGEEEIVCQICTVTRSRPTWRKTGTEEITIDSAAEESVCPREWGQRDYETKEPARRMKFVNASGGAMGHYGERHATLRAGSSQMIMSLGFQVSDVQKPSVAVRRITEKGNRVQIGPEDEDNFIENAKTGFKIMMVRKGGSYVIPAEMVVEETGF